MFDPDRTGDGENGNSFWAGKACFLRSTEYRGRAVDCPKSKIGQRLSDEQYLGCGAGMFSLAFPARPSRGNAVGAIYALPVRF
jgi:hypothetical protein